MTRGAPVRAGEEWSYLYRSQLSHFSSCLTVLTLETPQFALLDAAHGALSVVEWPQPYWCTTLVHILARIGEEGALHSGERLLRAALSVVEEEGGVEDGRANWPETAGSSVGGCRRQQALVGPRQNNAERGSTKCREGAGRAPAGVWQEMGWKLGLHKGQQRVVEQQGQVARQLEGSRASSDNRSVRERVVGAFQRGQPGQQESFIRQTSQRAGLTVPLERC